MRRIAQSIFAIVLTIFTTTVVNLGIAYLVRDRGAVTIGSEISMGSTIVRPVEISNYKGEQLDGVIFLIPKAIQTKEIGSSVPVQIVDSPDNTGVSAKRRIAVNGITPHSVVRLLIPSNPQYGKESVQVLNAEPLHLTASMGDEAPDSLVVLFKATLPLVLIYGLFVGVGHFWEYSQKQELTKRIDEVDKRLADVKDEARRRLEESTNSVSRIKVLMLARISEYSRELQFWRDTIRKILYLQNQDRRSREAFLDEVSANLKTYQTRDSIPEFEVVSTMADMLVRVRATDPTNVENSQKHENSGSEVGKI